MFRNIEKQNVLMLELTKIVAVPVSIANNI